MESGNLKMFAMQTIASVDKSFRSLIQTGNYEKYVHAIINRSEVIFRSLRFETIKKQSHGESDFIDNNGQKYDAKLLFDKRQGALVGDPRNELTEWLEEMLNEKTEFSKCIKQRDLSTIVNTKLYSIMKERLKTVKLDEHAILFIPFPIVDEYKGSVFLQFATDFLQAVYNRLRAEGKIGSRRVYFIYPSGDPHEYVLRDENHHREYIQCKELEDFISYDTTLTIKGN